MNTIQTQVEKHNKKTMHYRSHFWLKKLRFQPLFLFSSPAHLTHFTHLTHLTHLTHFTHFTHVTHFPITPREGERWITCVAGDLPWAPSPSSSSTCPCIPPASLTTEAAHNPTICRITCGGEVVKMEEGGGRW